MTTIFIDIETKPTSDPELIAELRAGIKPPANYKKPETIAAWMASDGEAAADDAVHKTALDASAGEVIAVGVACDDDADPLVMIREQGASTGELDLLRAFYAAVNSMLEPVIDPNGRTVWGGTPHFVAHNAAFDLGFLWRRAVVLDCQPATWHIPAPATMRHGKTHFCTMDAWAGFRDRISLARLCRALNLPDPKQGEDGAFAWQWWQAGDLDRLREYNARDVAAVRAIWHRLNGGRAAA